MPYRTTLTRDEVQILRGLASALAAVEAVCTPLLGPAARLAEVLVATLETSIDAGVEAPLQTAVKAAPAPSDPWADHRRAHRRGTLSRITRDREVEAFVLGIIETMTYAQVVEAVARTFPPGRHISRSSLQRWWRKRSPAPKAQPRAPG